MRNEKSAIRYGQSEIGCLAAIAPPGVEVRLADEAVEDMDLEQGRRILRRDWSKYEWKDLPVIFNETWPEAPARLP